MNTQSRSTIILFVVILFSSSAINLKAKSIEKIDINDKQNITVVFHTNILENDKAKLRNWLKHASNALLHVYGEMPVDNFVTVMKATTRNYGTVPGGEVTHDMPPRVHLVVNTQRSLDELKADWTLYHELSHLLIPYDTGDARWLAEGLASYYQNIIQARAGMLSEEKMWLKLYQGFERANKQKQYSHQPLYIVSENIGNNHQFMRIYWSGALFWLTADIELRRSNKDMSLDKALKAMRNCCFDRYMNEKQTINTLDRLTQTSVFSRLHKQFSNSHFIPEYIEFLNSLGFSIQNDTVSLDSDKKHSKIRRAIYQGS